MKNYSVVVLVVLSLAFAGFAEAAKPKKRTRNANRVGAYAGASVGMTSFTGDQGTNEDGLVEYLQTQGRPFQNVVAETEDTDIGYQATFGFRFNRFFAAELGLVQYGELKTRAHGELNFGSGFVPTDISLSFSAGGPAFCAVGILPLNEKFEAFARVGYLFASTEREVRSHVDGETVGLGSSKGDSTELLLGLGFAWHINQIYSIRAEYQKLDEVGQVDRTGTEDMNVISLGMIVRF